MLPMDCSFCHYNTAQYLVNGNKACPACMHKARDKHLRECGNLRRFVIGDYHKEQQNTWQSAPITIYGERWSPAPIRVYTGSAFNAYRYI